MDAVPWGIGILGAGLMSAMLWVMAIPLLVAIHVLVLFNPCTYLIVCDRIERSVRD